MFDWWRNRGMLAELSAEMVGTAIIVLFGDGAVAQVVAGGSTLGDHDTIAWSWGFGVALGVFVAGRISGAHLNPAVTLGLAIFRDFSWRRVLPFMLAQTFGAFWAALLVRWNYASVIDHFDPGHTVKSTIIFATQPGNGSLPVSTLGAFRDQIIGTAILIFLIFAFVDNRITAVPLANLGPILIGIVVVGIGMAFGTDAGYAINPARDLGPRLAQFLTGYHNAWRDQYGNLYFWVPILGPLIGGVAGAALYDLLIGRFLKPFEEKTGPGEMLTEKASSGEGR